MVAWRRIPEDENPFYGKRSFTFPLGNETYKISIDEAHPFDLFLTYRSKSWTWPIELIDRLGDQFLISGVAFFEEPVLSKTCWFELHCNDNPKIIYWGNQVIFRDDYSI